MAKGWLFLGRNKQSKTEAVNVDNGALEVKTVGNKVSLLSSLSDVRNGGPSATRLFGDDVSPPSTAVPLDVSASKVTTIYIHNNTDHSFDITIIFTSNFAVGRDNWRKKELALGTIAAGATLWISESTTPALKDRFMGLSVQIPVASGTVGTIYCDIIG